MIYRKIILGYALGIAPTCKFLKVKYHIQSSFAKSLIERTLQYINYKTDGFKVALHAKKEVQKDIINWLDLSSDFQNNE
jgi:putative transposase